MYFKNKCYYLFNRTYITVIVLFINYYIDYYERDVSVERVVNLHLCIHMESCV